LNGGSAGNAGELKSVREITGDLNGAAAETQDAPAERNN
jgi:hypothetical protein